MFLNTILSSNGTVATAAPSGYSNFETHTANSTGISSARKTATASSESPSNWTNPSMFDSWSYNIAIWQGEYDFPVIEANTTTSITTNQNTHNINLPAHSEGDLLYVCGYGANSARFSKPTGGWDFASKGSACIWWKFAQSNSESLSVNFFTADEGYYIAYRISGADRVDIDRSGGSSLSFPASSINYPERKVSRDYLCLILGVDSVDMSTTHDSIYYALEDTHGQGTEFVGTQTRYTGQVTVLPAASWSGATTQIQALIWKEGYVDQYYKEFSFSHNDATVVDPIDDFVDQKFSEFAWDGVINSGGVDRTNWEGGTSSPLASISDNCEGFIRFSSGSSRTVDTTNYWRWRGTIADLGIPSNAKVTGISEAGFIYGLRDNGGNDATSIDFGNVNGEGALVFDDGTTAHTLVNTISFVIPPSGQYQNETQTIDNTVSGLDLSSTDSVELRLNYNYNANAFTSTNYQLDIDDVYFLFDISTGETIAVDTKTFSLTEQNVNVIEEIQVATKTFSLTEQDVTVNAENVIDIGLFTFALTTYEPEVGKVNVDTYAFTGLTTNDVDFTVTVDVDAASFALSTNEALIEEAIPVELLTFTLDNTLDHEVKSGEFIITDLVTLNLTTLGTQITDSLDLLQVNLTTNEVDVFTTPVQLVVKVEQTKYTENTGGGAINTTITSAETTLTIREQYSWTVPAPTSAEWIAT